MKLEFDFSESVGCWVASTTRALERAFNEELAPHGLTFRQAQVLGALAMHGGLAQVDLADHLSVEPPTLVRILDRMEDEGWIRRTDCPDDRRRKIIVAQRPAQAVWKKVVATAHRVRARATAGLSKAKLRQLKDTLAHLRANLGEEEERVSA